VTFAAIDVVVFGDVGDGFCFFVVVVVGDGVGDFVLGGVGVDVFVVVDVVGCDNGFGVVGGVGVGDGVGGIEFACCVVGDGVGDGVGGCEFACCGGGDGDGVGDEVIAIGSVIAIDGVGDDVGGSGDRGIVVEVFGAVVVWHWFASVSH